MEFRFKLSKTEIKILKLLHGNEGISVSNLSKGIGKTMSTISENISSLMKKGFLRVSKENANKRIYFSDVNHAVLFKRFLSEYTYMNIDILSDSAIEILSHLTYEAKKKKEMVHLSFLSERTIQSVLSLLREYGIVLLDEEFQYSLNTRFDLLREFILVWRQYYNQKISEDFSIDAVILWQRGREFIMKTSMRKQMKNFLPTALSTFHEHNIQLILPEQYYYFYIPFKDKLRAEDILLHTLIIGPNDTRIIIAALLFWKKLQKIDEKYLKKEMHKYQLEKTVKNLIIYLKNPEKKPEYFPSKKELNAKLREYEI